MRGEMQLAVGDKAAFFDYFIILGNHNDKIALDWLTLPVAVLKPPRIAVNRIYLVLGLPWLGGFQLA